MVGQGAASLWELWQQLAGRGCVLWYDNFYKRLYRSTPREPMLTFNTTVMSVMRPLGGIVADFEDYRPWSSCGSGRRTWPRNCGTSACTACRG